MFLFIGLTIGNFKSFLKNEHLGPFHVNVGLLAQRSNRAVFGTITRNQP